jgi:hypothetical protein
MLAMLMLSHLAASENSTFMNFGTHVSEVSFYLLTGFIVIYLQTYFNIPFNAT